MANNCCFFKKMIVLWKLCTAVGFKIREIKCFTRGQFLQHCLPASHLLRAYPSLLSWGSGPVIHRCAFHASCRRGHGTGPGPSWSLSALSPQLVPAMGTGPMQVPAWGLSLDSRKKDKNSNLDSKSPSPLHWEQTEKRSQPRGKGSQVSGGCAASCSRPVPTFSCMSANERLLRLRYSL